MKDCKLRCIDCSQSFRKGDIYHVVDNELEGDDKIYNISEYNTVREINKDFEAQFEIVEEEFDSLTLSEINSKYGSDCHDEIVDVIKKYSKPLDNVYIDVFKSIIGLVDGATYYQNGNICDSDGLYIFTIKQNLPLGDKQYILQEEINKYESANR